MNEKLNMGPIISLTGGSSSCYLNATACFRNKTIFPYSKATGGAIGLTTEQFADASNFTGWDFENTWEMVTRTKIEIDSEGNETQVSETYSELKIFLQREREAQQAQNN